MPGYYHYTGHDVMGAYIDRKLGPIGWRRSDGVADADVAFTYCVSSTMLEDAYFDDGGLVKNAMPGTVLCDLSPSTPSLAREISAVALVNDLVFVEAPLAVHDPFSDLEFTCFAACEEPDGIERVRELLGAIAETVEEAEAVGSAQLSKAAHTVRMTADIVAAIESEALVRSTRETAEEKAGDEAFSGGFPLGFLLADVVAAMTAADDVDLILPQLEAAMHLLELMVVIGGAEMGPGALSLLYREEAASAAHGLDWTRAEALYADHDHGHGHDHDHGHDHGYDEYGYDDDDFGFAGGFGGYSAN